MGNEKGFSLVEVIVVMGILAIIAQGFTSYSVSIMKQIKKIESAQVSTALVDDLNIVISKRDTCENALRSSAEQRLVYSPPADLNASYSKDIPYIYLGEQSIIAGPELKADRDYSRYIEVQMLSLERITGAAVKTFNYDSPTMGIIPVSIHRANLVALITRANGTAVGSNFQFSRAVNLLVDNSTNQVLSCEYDQTRYLKRAIGVRRGAAIDGHGCVQDAPDEFFLANSCPDVDGNRFCDDGGGLVVDQSAGLSTGRLTLADFEFVTSTDLGTVDEVGRCPFEAKSMPENVTNDEVFALYSDKVPNADGVVADGLGCRTENGWYLSGCMRADDGMGDSDLIVEVEGTVEFCKTNDFTQPHYGRGPWSISAVRMTVICTKYE